MFTTGEQELGDTSKCYSTCRTAHAVVFRHWGWLWLAFAFLLFPGTVTAEDDLGNGAGVARLHDTRILPDGFSQTKIPVSLSVAPDDSVVLPLVSAEAEIISVLTIDENPDDAVENDAAGFVQLPVVSPVINPYADRVTYNPRIEEPPSSRRLRGVRLPSLDRF